jgi:hypothetical protein
VITIRVPFFTNTSLARVLLRARFSPIIGVVLDRTVDRRCGSGETTVGHIQNRAQRGSK